MKKQQSIAGRSTIRNVFSVAESILLAISKGITVNDAFLATLIVLLTEKNNLLADLINKKRVNSILSPKDAIRDDKTRVVFLLVEVFLLSTDAAIKEKAQLVSEVLNRYGLSIINKSYSDQTADTVAMLADLDEPAVSEAIDGLANLRNAINELRLAQNDWKETYDINADNNINWANTPSASKLRVEVRDIVNYKLMPYLYTMNQVNPEIYSETFNKVSDIIDTNNNNVRNHLNRIKDGEQEVVAEDIL